MTVIVANDTPDAIRGMLKRWFIEPKPNVFVGTISRRTREKTLEYIKRNAADISFLLITSDSSVQGFRIEEYNEPNRRGTTLSGLYLVAEKWAEESEDPF